VTFNDLTIECSQALSNANASTAFHVTDTTGFVANNVRATQCRKFLVPDNCDAVFKNLWLDQSAIALPGVSLGNGNYCVDIEATTGAAKIVFEDMTWFGLGYEIFGSELWHLFENSTNATSGHEIEFRGKLNYTCTGAYRRINLNVAHATKICVRRNAKENTGISSWNDGFTVGSHFSRGTVIANGAGTSQSIAFCGTTPSDSIGFNCITKAGTPGAIVSTRTSGTGFAVSFASGDTSTYEYWIG
jgi:hypothetical protein